MKKVLSIFFTLFLFSSVNAEDISKKVSEYVSNIIPGEGDTEVSIDLRENYKPDYSILAVREIEKTEKGNMFTQFSLFNTEKNNDERSSKFKVTFNARRSYLGNNSSVFTRQRRKLSYSNTREN